MTPTSFYCQLPPSRLPPRSSCHSHWEVFSEATAIYQLDMERPRRLSARTRDEKRGSFEPFVPCGALGAPQASQRQGHIRCSILSCSLSEPVHFPKRRADHISWRTPSRSPGSRYEAHMKGRSCARPSESAAC